MFRGLRTFCADRLIYIVNNLTVITGRSVVTNALSGQPDLRSGRKGEWEGGCASALTYNYLQPKISTLLETQYRDLTNILGVEKHRDSISRLNIET